MRLRSADIHTMKREILAYLGRRPNACDTLEGVLQWWLPTVQLEEARDIATLAMQQLVEEQKVEQVHVQARVVVFRLNAKRYTAEK